MKDLQRRGQSSHPGSATDTLFQELIAVYAIMGQYDTNRDLHTRRDVHSYVSIPAILF